MFKREMTDEKARQTGGRKKLWWGYIVLGNNLFSVKKKFKRKYDVWIIIEFV